MMHTSGPAGTSRAFLQRIAGTLVGQDHAPTETSRPLSTGPDPCGPSQGVGGRPSFATPLIGFWAHGARPHIHPAITVGGPSWYSVCDGLHVFLVLGQHFRILVIMRLRSLATIATDPLFEIIRTIVSSTVTAAREATSAQAASRHPPPWARSLQVHFSFGVESPYTYVRKKLSIALLF